MGTRLTPTQAFARSVKRARQLHDWNQHQLAERLTELGVPTRQSTVARVETGKRGVSLDDALAYSVALDVPLVRLIAGQAVDDDEIALVPKAVWPADLAYLHQVGHFYFADKRESPGRLYGWWKGRGEAERDKAFWDRAKREGRVRVETATDGTTVWVLTDATEGDSDAS